MMQVSVRDVGPDDAEGIVGILNPIIRTGLFTVFDTPFTVDDERAFMAGFPERGIWKVAVRESDRAIVGFQVVEPIATFTQACNHVGTFGTYVDLALRRQGIASRLFEATFAAGPTKGYEKFFTFVRADNEAALRTYLKHGFVEVGRARRHAKIGGRYIDEIVIERHLDDPQAGSQ